MPDRSMEEAATLMRSALAILDDSDQLVAAAFLQTSLDHLEAETAASDRLNSPHTA